MIQELLGGSASGVGAGGFNIGGGGGGERKLFSSSNGLQNTNPSHHFSPSPSPTPSSSTPKATKAAGHDSKTSTTTTSNAHDQNLRCPRCDSSNTKFCYYNNYNLTQPRHFCKTCRRYWTKGGALRNVPIGGGCRKNRSSSTTAVTSASNNNKSSGNNNTSKFKNLPSEIGIIRPSGPFDHIYHDHGHHLQYSNPNIVWASPQNSHLLSLLRSATTATQFQNPNPNPNPSSAVKEEGRMVGTHMLTDPAGAAPTDLGLDPMNIGQVPSLGLCSSFWKNNQLGQENGFTAAAGGGGGGGDHQHSGIQDLYQRLRLSSSTTENNNYYSTERDNSAAAAAGGGALLLSNSKINNNNVLTYSSTAPSTSILDSAPVAAGAGGADPLMGYCWNPAFSSWSDHLPTTNGAYP